MIKLDDDVVSPYPEVMFIPLHLENYLCLFWGFIVTVKCILEIPNWIHMQVVVPFLSVKGEDMVSEEYGVSYF